MRAFFITFGSIFILIGLMMSLRPDTLFGSAGMWMTIFGAVFVVPFVPNLIAEKVFERRLNWGAIFRRATRDIRPNSTKKPFDLMAEGKCPNCYSKKTLLAGPCGGASQNVACSACGHHFTVTPGLGLVVEDGKMDDGRAKSVFGIDTEGYTA